MPSLSSPPLHLLGPCGLPTTSSSPLALSVLTYNVLLPNSEDGWWNYKMYSPSANPRPPSSLNLDVVADARHTNHDDEEEDITSWNYRQKLLRECIATANPDIVCFQETSPLSFASDFQFMDELGYDGTALYRKGRFRPATFWREERWRLAADVVHRDRTMLTVFKAVGDGGDGGDGGDPSYWHVLNCHLQAGAEGKRRLRQIEDGVKASVKAAKRLNEPDPSNPNLIICGDFNGGAECGAVRYLEDGEVGPDFLEDGVPVTSKPKVCPLPLPMIDVAAAVSDRPPPPTLVVNELISLMVCSAQEEGGEGKEDGDDGGEEERYRPRFVQDVLDRLQRAYATYASHPSGDADADSDGDMVMNCADVERWLIDINRQVGRGSEFRTAAKEMGWVEPPPPEPKPEPSPESSNNNNSHNNAATTTADRPRIVLPTEGTLSLDGFINVYRNELHGGKYWGIAYDLAVMGEPLPIDGLFEARFDRMYCHAATLRPTAVLDTVAAGHCPSEDEPSDHLPVAARFERIVRPDDGDGVGDA